jgi:uncharacterized protein (DUF3084 family)
VSVLLNFVAPTAVAALFGFLGIFLTSRVNRQTAKINDKHLDYDQIQEDLQNARTETREAHQEASTARREAAEARADANRCYAEQVQMRRDYEAQLELDQREIVWRDLHIVSLVDHINRRLPPPPPARPGGIGNASN